MQRKKSKKLILAFGLCLLSGVLLGCGSSQPKISVQDYNNQLISYQTQALDSLDAYFSRLEKEYDGKNLHQLYQELKTQIESLKTQAIAHETRNGDAGLKDAVVRYLSGLESALEENEKPIVDLIEGHTGEMKEFYQQERDKINQLTLNFAKKLASLDDALAQQQAKFSHQHGYTLE